MTTRVSLWLGCIVIIVVSIPMILRKIPPNSSYGFRTKLTLSSPDIWYPANTFSGWAMLVAAGISVIALSIASDETLARTWIATAIFIVPLILSLVASLIYLRRFG
jgi:uncharacterized membrane protein